MGGKRAQAAVEFLTVYGWVILLALVAIAFLYYYGMFDPMRFVQKQCNFQTDLGCTTYLFEKINPTTMRLSVEFSNNLGYDISFQPNSTVIKTENIGKTGKANYTGTCVPIYPAIIRPGQRATCIFYITDTQAVPSLGKNSVFKIEMNYTICDTDPNYLVNGSCSAGSTYAAAGTIVTPMESYSPVFLYCGDGYCNSSIGETLTTCPADCTRCGDYVCSPPKENKSSCCTDCGCQSGYYCSGNICKYSGGGGGGGGCLIKDSLILTPEGYKKIQDLNVGDEVIGFDFAKGERVATKITVKTIESGKFLIYVYNGIKFAANHEVFVSNEWVGVKDIAERTEAYVGYVYNIETATENYFGKNETFGTETLIHNLRVVLGAGGGYYKV